MRGYLLVPLLILLNQASVGAGQIVGEAKVSVSLGTIGFAGRYKENYPGPVTVRVTNKGAAFDADLTISVRDPISQLQVVNVSRGHRWSVGIRGAVSSRGTQKHDLGHWKIPGSMMQPRYA